MAITKRFTLPNKAFFLRHGIGVAKLFYPSYFIWDKKIKQKTIYLTFDDGPFPEVTQFVLDTLSRKHHTTTNLREEKPIPATFFCIGENVRKHPEIFKAVIEQGHAVGNHTYNHPNGRLTDNTIFLKNTHIAELEMAKHLNTAPDALSTNLFRPPYGQIKRAQAKALHKLGYTIIMYRVVAFDWEESISPEETLQNVIQNTRDGDIIVFHDSMKAFDNLKYALPKAIDYFIEKGFSFGKL